MQSTSSCWPAGNLATPESEYVCFFACSRVSIDAVAMMRPGLRRELEEARKQHSESKEGRRMHAVQMSKEEGICRPK